MSSPTLSLEATTIHIAQEIEVHASIEVTFSALLDQLGPYNETEVDRPMPMKLEAWPGGRWFQPEHGRLPVRAGAVRGPCRAGAAPSWTVPARLQRDNPA